MADDSYEFDALPAERQKLLLDWIRHNLKPIKSINPKSGSGTLKAGYRTENREAVNWTFNVSQRSPAILAIKHPK